MEYIIDQYDKENKLSYDTLAEKYQIKQWIAFQISGKCYPPALNPLLFLFTTGNGPITQP